MGDNILFLGLALAVGVVYFVNKFRNNKKFKR